MYFEFMVIWIILDAIVASTTLSPFIQVLYISDYVKILFQSNQGTLHLWEINISKKRRNYESNVFIILGVFFFAYWTCNFSLPSLIYILIFIDLAGSARHINLWNMDFIKRQARIYGFIKSFDSTRIACCWWSFLIVNMLLHLLFRFLLFLP